MFCRLHAEIFPNTNVPAHIRKYALVEALSFPTSGEAWQMVLREISRVGGYKAPEIQDPIVAEAVRCVGWKDICYSENVEATRAHFMKAYDQLLSRKKQEILMGGL